jgi:ATP-dependent Lhr-like helicase
MQWRELRSLQVEAIHAVLDTQQAILVSAATASGKTEAAFLPILSQIAKQPQASVQALYIGPLRALINDQFTRVAELCTHLHIPVHHWHGDVSAKAKHDLIERPAGVLLITPESLESLFVNRSFALHALFGYLEYIVIDELHVFLGTERGRQLESLLLRLGPFCKKPPRRIGLSATLGKDGATARAVRRMLASEGQEELCHIEDQTQKPLGYRVHTYLKEEQKSTGKDDDLITERLIAADVARFYSGKTSLIFANKRGSVEEYADLCRPLTPNEVSVHHGSLSREIREDAETLLKNKSKVRAVTTFCSSTLELGIDLGDVEAVGQIETPPSVASLKQRLGRSGRGEGQQRIIRVFLEEEAPREDSSLFDRLHLELIQTIAVTELMLEGWVEPPRDDWCDFSTLTQQIISVISQTGGIRADRLYAMLCGDGAFRQIEEALFVRLLRCLGTAENDVIEQTPTGELILGLHGEKLRHSRDFYAVFLTPREYALLHDGRSLGKLPLTMEVRPEEHLIFAGRRWQVLSVDRERWQIHVAPARGRKKPRFLSESVPVHMQIRQKMRHVLSSETTYPYLDVTGESLLRQARNEAARVELDRQPILPLSNNESALLLWAGDDINATAALLLRRVGTEIKEDVSAKGIALVTRHNVDYLRKLADQASKLQVETTEWLEDFPVIRKRKYDGLFGEGLLKEAFGRDELDVTGAQAVLTQVLRRD